MSNTSGLPWCCSISGMSSCLASSWLCLFPRWRYHPQPLATGASDALILSLPSTTQLRYITGGLVGTVALKVIFPAGKKPPHGAGCMPGSSGPAEASAEAKGRRLLIVSVVFHIRILPTRAWEGTGAPVLAFQI